MTNKEMENKKLNYLSQEWKIKGHPYQIADTGDYGGHYEITNGKISLLTKEENDEVLQPIVDALNNSGCKFYQDDWFEFENKLLKERILKEIYVTYDKSDGEIFCAFVDKEQCKREAEESGCGMQSVRLVLKQ